MSYLNRAWMAATVSVMNCQADGQGHKLKSGLGTFQHGKKRFSTSSSSSSIDPADLRPLSGILGSDAGGFTINSCGEDRRNKQADESLRHAMYMNCWGPS